MHISRFHSVYDLGSCNSNIGNREKLKELIRGIVEAIRMNIIAGPFVAEGNPAEPGVTAVAIIDFSHVSIHTFTKSREAFVDVFSIKEFDCDAVGKLVKTAFGTSTTSVRHRRV